jgi:uncharacterized protein
MIWTAIILGFAGSLHCMGMCSPLAMAVANLSPTVILNRILYNAGRVLTYGVLGSIVSTVGLAFPLIKFQNLLSILLGIALLVIGISGVSAIRIPVVTTTLARLNIILKKLFSGFLQDKNHRSTFILGSLNGLLPCGLSFLALTYCITLAKPWDGFGFMLLFGLGTLPVMLGFTSVFNWLILRLHVTSQRLTTSLMIVSGVLLIVRVFIIHVPEAGCVSPEVIDIVVCASVKH